MIDTFLIKLIQIEKTGSIGKTFIMLSKIETRSQSRFSLPSHFW